MRTITALFAVLLIGPAVPGETFLREVPKDDLVRLAEIRDEGDWPATIDAMARLTRRHGGKLVPVRAGVWKGLEDHLLEWCSGFPKEAWEAYRTEHDPAVRSALIQGDVEKLEQLVTTSFFSSFTDDGLDFLANRSFHAGRFDSAFRRWLRLLRYYPDTDLPRELLAARAACACLQTGNITGLRALRALVKKKGIDEESVVSVGGAPQRLKSLLETRPRARDAGNPHPSPEIDPTVPRRSGVARSEILLRKVKFEKSPTPATAFSMFPAHAQVGERKYLLFNNGLRLIAVDPDSYGDRGVWWRHPYRGPLRAPDAQNGSSRFGCTVDGGTAYACMYAEKRLGGPRAANDRFHGPTSIRAVNLRTGRVRWQTDRALKKFDFSDMNWAFSTAPVVQGDRIYVGVHTTPAGEQESWVVCLNKSDGRPLWATFLASVMPPGLRFRVQQHPKLTLVQESGGMLFVQTNLGAVASVHADTGNIAWITTYRRETSARASFHRPASPAFLRGGRLHVLPQDSIELLVIDALRGGRVDADLGGRVVWRKIDRMLPVDSDWMILAGLGVWAVRMKEDGLKAYALASSGVSRGCGAGTVQGRYVYLPSRSGRDGKLSIYDRVGWRMLHVESLASGDAAGNLDVFDERLSVATSAVDVFTHVVRLEQDWAARTKASPVHPPTILDFADRLQFNDREVRAAAMYLRFVRAASGDPKYERDVARARYRLRDLFKKFIPRADP